MLKKLATFNTELFIFQSFDKNIHTSVHFMGQKRTRHNIKAIAIKGNMINVGFLPFSD